MKRRVSVFVLAAGAVGLGLVIGILSAGFLKLVDLGQHVLWKAGWADFPYAPLLICTLGGILVGLCQRYLGDHPKSLHGAIEELRETGRLAYAHLPHGLLSAAISLVFGASLGPEAAIVSLLGGLSTWAADRLRALRGRLGVPCPSSEGSRLHRLARQWPNTLALAVGFVIFFLGMKGLYSGGVLNMNEPFVWSDVLWAIPLGIIGALFGCLYRMLLGAGRRLTAPLCSRPVLRATLAGGILGAAASWLPMMLFSGQYDMQAAYLQASQLGVGQLSLIALVRLAMIALLLASGWKGGPFFPLMFASAALGLGMSQALSFISAPVGALGIMAGLLIVVLPQPLIILAFMALLFPLRHLGIIAAAILAATAGKAIVDRRWLPTRQVGHQPIE